MARFIEHTNLSTTISDRQVDALVDEAKQHGFVGVCVPPFWVKKAQREIASADIQLVTVVGFPLGYQMTETRIEETRMALRDGATEIDLVMNISAFKMGHPWCKIDLAKIADLVHEHDARLKVIIETAYLSDEQVVKAATMSRDAGADFVKTSTGLAPAGATEHHVRLLRETLPSHVGLKASGGIRTFDQAVRLIEAGADRIGTSQGVAIVTGS